MSRRRSPQSKAGKTGRHDADREAARRHRALSLALAALPPDLADLQRGTVVAVFLGAGTAGADDLDEGVETEDKPPNDGKAR